MKMENEIRIASAGSIGKLHVREGEQVSEGDLLVDLLVPE